LRFGRCYEVAWIKSLIHHKLQYAKITIKAKVEGAVRAQRKRVDMGRALMRRPRLFLLDELLSNLDARLRINVRLELMRLHKQIQGTILYVIHNQVEAMTLGDKVVIMREGRIHQIDRPEMIYDRSADTFVASFIGSPAMNLFKGTIIRVKNELLLSKQSFFVTYPQYSISF
jgi:ABC-type sugar transport system ATPase subunit